MSRYFRIALATTLLSASALGAGWFFLAHQPEVHVSMETPARRPPSAAELDKAKYEKSLLAVAEAERIADPRQRCLHYPDPPDVAWPPKMIAELCRVTTFEYVSLDDIAQRLAAGDAAGVDKIFNDYAARDRSDPESHGIWFGAIDFLFDNNVPKVDQVVQKWVKAAPNSAHARVARAAFELNRSRYLRGGKWISVTPLQSLEAMNQWTQRAIADLRAAIKLDPQSKSAFQYLILAQRGDAAAVDEAAHQALALDPIDDVTYMAWLQSADPRWDSTPNRVESILAASQPYRDRNPLLTRLDARAEWFRQLECCRNNNRHPNYLAAVRLAPDQLALQSLLDWGASKQSLLLYASQVIRFTPTSRAYLDRREIGSSEIAAYDAARSGGEDLASAERALRLYNAPPGDVAAVLIAQGKPAQAAEEYRKLLSDNPRDIGAIRALIDLDVDSLNRRDEARKFAALLIELEPKAADTWVSVAGVEYEDLTKYCEAVQRYHAANDYPGGFLQHEARCNAAVPGSP